MPNNIAILSLHTPNLQPLADLTWPNKVEYASNHGYQTHCKTDGFTMEYVSGEKMPFIRQYFRDHPEVEWAWFVDTDTLITNFHVPIEWCLDPDYHFIISNDINGVNAGSFFVRNSPEGTEFLDWMIDVYPLFVNEHKFMTEQAILQFALNGNTFPWGGMDSMSGGPEIVVRKDLKKYIKIQPQRMFNSYAPYNGVPEASEWKSGDFLVHWPARSMEDRVKMLYPEYSRYIMRIAKPMFSVEARRPLVDLVMKRTGGKVQRGPFKGMIILPEFVWGDGDAAGKLLGLYENELHVALEDVIAWNPDNIVNVGCAEGFYGIGLALRCKPQWVTFIDVDKRALDIAKRNFDINGGKPKGTIDVGFGTWKVFWGDVPGLLGKSDQRPFVFMDCEGAEEDLLDLVKAPELAKARIIVESHDCIRPGLMVRLIERFRGTHDIEVIGQGTKNPYLDIIADLDDVKKMLITCEFRPSTMYWLYLVPK